MLKTTSNSKAEYIHETFVGKFGTNILLKDIPNFCYVFGMYGLDPKDRYNQEQYKEYTENVVTEYIEGVTFAKYINDGCSVDDIIFVLMQLASALLVAQNRCGFIHWDLTPQNVMIKDLGSPKEFNYVVDHNKVITLKTRYLPIIINYGKSHIVHDNIHHGHVNPYKTSNIQDIFTIIITSISQILSTHRRFYRDDYTKLFILINFMSGTDILKRSINTPRDLISFVQTRKKYGTLIDPDKKGLLKSTPLDFLKYIDKMMPYSVAESINASRNHTS